MAGATNPGADRDSKDRHLTALGGEPSVECTAHDPNIEIAHQRSVSLHNTQPHFADDKTEAQKDGVRRKSF